MKMIVSLLIGLFLCGSTFAEDTLFSFEFEELSDGVWAGVRPDAPRFPVMGNTMFVISNEGVVVYDGGGVPLMSEQIIEKVRSLTDKPVTHVVISHWHGDHAFGVYRFAEEYPDVQFIAHRFTAEAIDSPKIAYIDGSATFYERNGEYLQSLVDTGKDKDGNAISEADRQNYARMLEDADVINSEYQRVRIVAPNVIIDESFTINSGGRVIELLNLGHANTAGDILMWLPEERIVATGDIVVLPSPYAFNMPPKPWAETLRNIKKLNYRIMVPGHGPVQRDTEYVDLLIQSADSIADQRDAMLADGLATEEVEAALDFSAIEQKFTGGDEYIKVFYDGWFEEPFRKAAMKALTGEPMVEIVKPEEVSFDDERWQIEAKESKRGSYLGQDALKLLGGSALLTDTDIRNGIVEFDIASSGERGFAGLMFRVQDAANYEHFYIRPHQSGMPDANQYTPVFNGVSAWQLYHGSEYSVPLSYRNNEWMHVKVVYADTRADIYIDSDKPVLRVNNLKRDVAGGFFGINAANFSPAHFANVRFTKLANSYVLAAQPSEEVDVPTGRVTSWSVSEPFGHDALDGLISIGDDVPGTEKWTTAKAEESGALNLASVAMQAVGKNTRFARLTINSESSQAKLLQFGYSDVARVFVNGELQYVGDNTYQSRDYRYLGTIGLFDSVVLPLREGDNEILIAVTEAFGGWGVMAVLDSLDGVTIKYAE
jgi:glyoxylase-like metal-dependent hydrolase (beta-lactamase superfamily II)